MGLEKAGRSAVTERLMKRRAVGYSAGRAGREIGMSWKILAAIIALAAVPVYTLSFPSAKSCQATPSSVEGLFAPALAKSC